MKYRIESLAIGRIGDAVKYQVQYFKIGWFYDRWVDCGCSYYYLKDAEQYITLIANEIETDNDKK